MRQIACLLLCLAIAAAAGCGQKGPLYLPDDEQQQEDET